VDSTRRGIVVMRYSFSTVPPKDPGPDGMKRYNPVDVELGWYSVLTGKAQKVKLPQVKPFRVGRSGPSALTAILDGGLLFLPLSGEAPIYFVSDAGKVQTIPRPPSTLGGGFSSGYKNGNFIVLSELFSQDNVLVYSNDLGKTWSSSTWTLGESAQLVPHEGKPALLLGASMWDGGSPNGLIPFATVTPDPPTSLRFPQPLVAIGAKGITTCSKPGFTFAPPESDEARELHVVVAGDTTVEFTTSAGGVRGALDGTTCTDSIYASSEGSEQAQLFVSPADPTHAWLTRPSKVDSKFEARPLTCTLP
jgi:hypothetical protein